jgi:stress-induced morphogen
MSKGPIYSSIESKLNAAFNPIKLVIEDQSHMHRGHAGVQDAKQSETHFSIELVSDMFKPLNRVQRQREVNKVLSDEFEKGLHALSLTCKTTEES